MVSGAAFGCFPNLPSLDCSFNHRWEAHEPLLIPILGDFSARMVRGIMVLEITPLPREALLAAIVALPVVGDDTPVHRESTLSCHSTLQRAS
jgi:hypothetical protein